jgi:hypothetical protein
MEINSISKKYIRICPKHSDEIFAGLAERKEYRFCKKKSLYILRDPSCLSSNAIDLDNPQDYRLLLTSKKSTDSNLSTSDSSLSSLDGNERAVRKNNSFVYSHINSYIEEIENGEYVVKFGKYKGLTFNQLLKKDRKYCVNILEVEERKNREVPNHIKDFSDYVKRFFKKN